MALILTIDTAMERGSIGLFDGMRSLGSLINDSQKDHAGFVQSAIGQVMQSADHDFDDLDAIAVVNGPGSYTGLRVGLSTAKGLCYAMDKRLITLNTLELMAFASIAHFSSEYYFYIPMIDARREDVFMGVYDHKLNLIAPQQPLTLSIDFFEPFANEKNWRSTDLGSTKHHFFCKSWNLYSGQNHMLSRT